MIQHMNEWLRNGKGFLLIGMLVALLTACGGSDDNGSAGPDPSDPNPSAPIEDEDNDGIEDAEDNCPAIANPEQEDDDGDGIGNACEDDSNNDDTDGDGVTDDIDNCPEVANPGQEDADGDGTGDACETGDGLAFDMFQAASFVIGQQDFSGGEPHQGGARDANTLNMPLGGVGYSAQSDVLFIADSANARVLGYLGLPDMNNMNADFVLGQPDFTSGNQEVSRSGMISPEAVTTTGGMLMVTDTDANRVAVYDGIPTAGGAEPVIVVGQTSPDVYTAACDQSTLIHPHAHFLTPDGKLLVADAGNNRVLVWNEMPTETGEPADFVLGQVDFNNCSFADPENYKHPAALWSDGEQLIIADSEHHRILIWNTFPTENFQEPDVILGQSSIMNIMPNDDDQDGVTDPAGTATARTLSYPRDIAVHDGKLYVADMDNHRVLIWNEIPTETFAPADNVLGQANFTANTANAGEAEPNERGFQRPVGVTVIDDQLFVTEWENSRVMVFEGQ